MNPIVIAALITGAFAFPGGIVTAFYLFRGTLKTAEAAKTAAKEAAAAVIQVKTIDAGQDLLRQTREELKSHKDDIAILKREADDERKARHTLEDTVQTMKVQITDTSAELARVKEERKRIQQDYEEEVGRMHDETLLLQNKVKFLQEENDGLKARVLELETQLAKQESRK